jgi:hypothetical protein
MQWQSLRWGTLSRGTMGTMFEGGGFRCALCRGKGVLRSGKTRCPVCSGRGLVRVTPPAMICSYCSGRGEVPASSGITCTVCGGKGVVSVHEPIEACPSCRGTGAAPNSKLPCLMCRGKGVVTTSQYPEAITKVRGSHAEKPQVRREAELAPISVYHVPLPAHRHEVGEETWGGYAWQPQLRRETRVVSPGAVGGLVRRLMATERARILGGKVIDVGRYSLEKRTQRWRESKERFK